MIVDHHLGVDTIALVAMVGALALDQELAGAVIGLMVTGGAALEAVASRRAERELTRLVQRAPRVAHLHVNGDIQEVPVDAVRAGDTVLVRTGEVVPVDGTVAGHEAVVDTSTLSGEPLPITLRSGMAGIIVKGAGAIETLGEARTVLFDKTGTLTVGMPEVREIVTLDGLPRGEVLRLAASVDRIDLAVILNALRALHG